MITLIKGGRVFAPNDLGTLDILLVGGKIRDMQTSIDLSASDYISVIDGRDSYIIPGLVDSLVHITGGGGEGGFATRTREIDAKDISLAGVTSLVGALGTDSVTRSQEDLLAKTKELRLAGISAYAHTGSYRYPVKTLFDTVQKDLILIEEFIGVGEVAIADHRGSQISASELARLASEARVGGMLSGKGGIVSLHCGDGEDGLEVLHRCIAESNIPITQFLPTHINRNRRLFEEGLAFAHGGGYIDFTTSTTEYSLSHGEVSCPEALAEVLETQCPIDRVTMSSDANASLPDFNDQGELISMSVGQISSLFDATRRAVLDYHVPLDLAVQTVTANPARALGLHDKGRLKVGGDADVVMIDRDSLSITDVFQMGRHAVINLVYQEV